MTNKCEAIVLVADSTPRIPKFEALYAFWHRVHMLRTVSIIVQLFFIVGMITNGLLMIKHFANGTQWTLTAETIGMLAMLFNVSIIFWNSLRLHDIKDDDLYPTVFRMMYMAIICFCIGNISWNIYLVSQYFHQDQKIPSGIVFLGATCMCLDAWLSLRRVLNHCEVKQAQALFHHHGFARNRSGCDQWVFGHE